MIRLLYVVYGLLMLIPSCFQKVEVGDIYENQLTRNRFMITEAHFGEYYLDSLSSRITLLRIQKESIIQSSKHLYSDNITNLHSTFESVLKYGTNLEDMNDYTNRWSANFYNGISEQVGNVRLTILRALPVQTYYYSSFLARGQVQTNKNFVERSSDSLCDVFSERDFDNELSQLQRSKALFKTYDTYFACTDYNEFKYKYLASDLYLINADTMDFKLYKKIN